MFTLRVKWSHKYQNKGNFTTFINNTDKWTGKTFFWKFGLHPAVWWFELLCIAITRKNFGSLWQLWWNSLWCDNIDWQTRFIVTGTSVLGVAAVQFYFWPLFYFSFCLLLLNPNDFRFQNQVFSRIMNWSANSHFNCPEIGF